MNTSDIISNGYNIIENRNNLSAYFVREFKKVERDYFYSADDFFKNCQSKLDDYKTKIDKTYQLNLTWYKKQIDRFKNNEGVFYPVTSNIPFNEIDLKQYSIKANKQEYERLKKEFSIFTIDKVDIKIGLKMPDLIKIEQALKMAHYLIKPIKYNYSISFTNEEPKSEYDIRLIQSNLLPHEAHNSFRKFNIFLFDKLRYILYKNEKPLFHLKACLEYHCQNSFLNRKDFKKYTEMLFLDSLSRMQNTPLNQKISSEIRNWLNEADGFGSGKNSEKYFKCTSKEFKKDISELCQNCPHTEAINSRVAGFINQLQDQKHLLPVNLFQDLLRNETLTLLKVIGSSNKYDLPKNNLMHPHEIFLSQNIYNYITAKEMLKALKDLTVRTLDKSTSDLSAFEIALRYHLLSQANKVEQLTNVEVANFYSPLFGNKDKTNIRKSIPIIEQRRRGGEPLANEVQFSNVRATLSDYPDLQKAIDNIIDAL